MIGNRPLRLAGLKKSGELSLLIHKGGLGRSLFALTSRLSRSHINIRMLAAEDTFGQAGLLIAPEYTARAMAEARDVAAEYNDPNPELIGQVVCFSFYPLSDNPTLPFYVTAKLAENGIHPLLMNTSTSAMMMVLNQAKAQLAEEIFTRIFVLPTGISPMDSEVHVVQTNRKKPED